MTKVLLTEGNKDAEFLDALLRELGIVGVDIKPPFKLGAGGNGKNNAATYLPTLLDQMRDGLVTRLAVVVDADYAQYLQGSAHAKGLFDPAFDAAGFQHSRRLNGGGFVYGHPDGLAQVGLWVMPDNHADGMLEDFVKEAITATGQAALFQLASSATRGVKNPFFDRVRHSTKAEVANWLAWQQTPGEPLRAAVGSRLLDFNAENIVAFEAWLQAVFG